MSAAPEARTDDVLGGLLDAARRAGAQAADALLARSAALSVQRRVGAVEHVERAESRDLGLRVFVGGRSAIVSTTDPDPAGFAALAGRAVAMARALPEDPHAAPPDRGAAVVPDLDLEDPAEPTVADLSDRAAAAEDAARAVRGVTNSEGAEAGWTRAEVALAGSAGFLGRYARTAHSVSTVVVAGAGTGMERDYDHALAVHLADLGDPAAVGRRAGERAVARLNPTRPPSAVLPVVYHPRVAGSLLSHLAAAANGAAVARGTSYLRDRMGEAVLAAGLAVRDDPSRPRGLRSRPFDAEGVASAPLALVEDGVLRAWLLDRRSAARLGLATTGHATRGVSGPPAPASTNLWLEPGTVSPGDLIADIALGFYATELIGLGLNPVTGDYSRGAAGFLIRNGALAEPVSGVTVAGDLPGMFRRMAVASDLEFRRGTDAPTIRVDGMTLAGA